MRIPFFTARREMHKMRDQALVTLMHSDLHIHEELKALRREVGARNPKRELLLIAAMNVADTFDDSQLAFDLAAHLREPELAALVELLRAAGRHEGVESWERFNVTNDDSEPEDQGQADPANV
jgi:ribonuclease D